MPDDRKPTKEELAEWLAEAESAAAVGREPDLTEDQLAALAKMTKKLTKEIRRGV
jgi:hypothetical protein